MLELSRRFGVPIFEDECYADLVFEKEYEHAIRSLDDSNYVLHVGSFSKSLAPGVRLGYVVAPWEVMSQILPFKMDIGTSTMGQMIVAEFLEKNFDSHMEHLKSGLERKRDTLIAALKEHFGPEVQPSEPSGRDVCVGAVSGGGGHAEGVGGGEGGGGGLQSGAGLGRVRR